MHEATITPNLGPAVRGLASRAAQLGAALWLIDVSGRLLPAFGTELPGYGWLGSDVIRQRLSDAQPHDDASADSLIEVEPGLLAIPLEYSGSTRLAVFLGEGCCQNPGYAADCVAAKVDPEQVREELVGVPRYTKDQLATVQTALNWAMHDLHELYDHEDAIDDLTEQLGHSYENITMMFRLGRSMSSIQAPHQITQSICEQLCATQSFGWVATRFRGDEESVPELCGQSVLAGELACDMAAFDREAARLLANYNADSWSKLLQIGQNKLADVAGSEIIIDPIHHDGRVVGLVMAGGKTGEDAEATSHDTQLVDAIASFLGTFHENAARFHEQRSMFIGTLEAVSAALDAKDRYTRGHSERVAYLATMLARVIGLDEPEIERLRIAGLVHDVGKIGVPEAVLCKTGRLTEDEFEKIKKHPRIGFNILKGIPRMEDILDGVLYHHERWDGRGYPDRLASEHIPLYGRILAVCDTFDAMSSTRSYRKAMPREKVLEEIRNCAGTQFDPQLTEPFIALNFDVYDEMVRRHQLSDDQGPAEKQAAA